MEEKKSTFQICKTEDQVLNCDEPEELSHTVTLTGQLANIPLIKTSISRAPVLNL